MDNIDVVFSDTKHQILSDVERDVFEEGTSTKHSSKDVMAEKNFNENNKGQKRARRFGGTTRNNEKCKEQLTKMAAV